MTASPDPAHPGRTFLHDAPAYPTAVALPSPHCPNETIPPPPPYPGSTPQYDAAHHGSGPESQSGPGPGQCESHEDFVPRGRVHLSRRQRSIDATAAAQLLLQLPSFLASLVIVAVLSQLLLPDMGWLGVLLWLTSGAMAFHRPTERAFARHLLNLRHPTPRELSRLEPLWRAVTARTGVEGRAYELWIEDSDHLNALAAAGHIVGVTRFSLERLSDGQLAAVLAHELGHHVRGHAWSSLLGQWYAVPGRVAWTVVRRLIWLVADLGRGRMGLWTAALLLVAGVAVLLVALQYWYVMLTLAAAPYLLAAVARRAEVRADHHAAAAGFGPMLAEVLHMMQTAERETGSVTASALSGCGKTAAMGTKTPVGGRGKGPLGKCLSSHPDYHTRLHHLAPYLKQR